MTETLTQPAAADIEAILRGQHGNPFAVLGLHEDGTALRLNVFAPDAATVTALDRASGKEAAVLERIDPEGFFSGIVDAKKIRSGYRLKMTAGGHAWEREDPYAFGPVLGDMDEYLIAEGRHEELYHRLGAHPTEHEGVAGTAFGVWAPNARRVSVVGHFNAWDGRRNAMRRRLGGGLWEIFLPGLTHGELYKFEIVGAYGETLPLKSDPLAFAAEPPPATGSIVAGLPRHHWQDADWLTRRRAAQPHSDPISIYEVHLGSWRRGGNGEVLGYTAIADLLVDYVTDMGFTHVELMPVGEHPFTGSWGYQPIGLFAPTARHGSPGDFAGMVDRLHQAGIGRDCRLGSGALPVRPARTGKVRRGTGLYEHEDPRLGFHKDWNTLIYNFGRTEVANFLRASGAYWIDQFHVDALRVDAVASMLYLDYSRNAGEWIPNRYGGRENLDAIEFLRGTNRLIHENTPGAMAIAEESTAFPGVSSPVAQGGLGFDFKWNMGWMHDTLEYMKVDPLYRKYDHDKMTFGLVYAFSENFVLPLSHDEVVHGKGSMLGKMPGDRWQQFANLRAYYGFMWTHPGKKLLFMGSEFAQDREWNHDQSLDWHLLDDPAHDGVRRLVRDLNNLYRSEPALHQRDCTPTGFDWIDGGDTERNVFSYLRWGEDGSRPVAVVCNMAPVVRENFRLGLPRHGRWQVLLNSDDPRYGGSNAVPVGDYDAQGDGSHGRPTAVTMTLPPLATVVLAPVG